jgi:hypothetical protein
MKPHPRIRKTIKWGGAVVTVLLVVVWVGSAWGSLNVGAGPLGQTLLAGGRYRWLRTDLPGRPGASWGCSFEPGTNSWVWIYQWDSNRRMRTRVVLCWERTPQSLFVLLVAWFPPLLAALPTAAAWWLDVQARRRARLNLCPKCTYDRAGIAGDAKCPECGCGGTSGRPASNEPRTK